MNNPIDMIKAIKNPQEFVMNYVKQNSNPILNNLVEQAQSGNTKKVEEFANNILKEQGLDLNDIMNSLK